jgi:hypothetical protein
LHLPPAITSFCGTLDWKSEDRAKGVIHAAACDRVTECSQEAAEVAAVVRNLAGKIADAGANLLASTNAYVRDVASGAMPMKPQVAPRVEAPAPPAPASVEYKNLYLFQDVLARGRWRNPLRLQAWPSFGSD